MTDPRTYLYRMISVLLLIIVISGILYKPILLAFLGNPRLNGVIVGVAVIGIGYVMRQVMRLGPEVRWLADIQRTKSLNPAARKPVVLATVNVMLADSRHDRQLSALSLRSVLDGVAARLDEGREISRYMIGLLIFLGLLGTFWGLLETIASVGGVVEGLDLGSTNFEQMMTQLRTGLDAPLDGMATAFSSSLFGLAGSLILGFLDLQLGQAMGRFFNEVEDWLSAFARYNDVADNGAGSAGNASLAAGLSEEGARAMVTLARAMEKSESDRTQSREQLAQLNVSLATLTEQMADDRRIREQLAVLNAQIDQLTKQLQDNSKEQSAMFATEVRALSKAILSNNKQAKS